jgi:hypothetical protein
MKKIVIAVALVLIILVYFLYPETVITFPPGVIAPDQPKQIKLIDQKVWNVGEFKIEALAEYDIKARVLSRNNFSFGKESEISPFDLVLGWGPMSDQSIIDKIDISQRNRWYRWKADVLPIPAKEITLNSANVHIVPEDELVEEKFETVYQGSLIEMKGYLVEITTADGWRWRSSMKRDDTAGGSCELFWVEDLVILDK